MSDADPSQARAKVGRPPVGPQITLRLPSDLLYQVDEARGTVERGVFLRTCIQLGLGATQDLTNAQARASQRLQQAAKALADPVWRELLGAGRRE